MAVDASSTILATIIGAGAGIIGGLIGAAVSLRTNTRTIKIENITKERAKWRDNVREKALWVQRAAVAGDRSALDEHHLAFTLILNPIDPMDRPILALIRQLKITPDEPHLTEFADRISLLLKHDWQRAKWEAEDNCFFESDIDPKPEPPRTTYEQFKREQGRKK
jgi:hypothetical protein